MCYFPYFMCYLQVSHCTLQITKNLVFLSKVLHRYELEHNQEEETVQEEEMVVNGDQGSSTGKEDAMEALDVGGAKRMELFKKQMLLLSADAEEEEEEEWPKRVELNGGCVGKKKKGLKWLAKKLARLAKYEAGHHPKESIKACSVFSSNWTVLLLSVYVSNTCCVWTLFSCCIVCRYCVCCLQIFVY